MKKAGIIVLLIGLLFTIIAIVGLLTKETVTDPAKIETAQMKIHHRIWEPMLGALVVIIGVSMYKAGQKKHTTHLA